jgi:hypothetical protein
MAEQTQKTWNTAVPALVCRLRRKLWSRRGPVSSPTAGEVEIDNVSSHVIEIEVRMHPLQYLHLEIVDACGNPVPAFPYGDFFSPREIPYIFRLAPGEKYIHNVGLLNGVPDEKQLPGTYTVRAVYEYPGMKAVSEPLEVQIPEPAAVPTGEVAGHLE